MEYYLSKLDLGSYPIEHINILKKYFNINKSDNDLLWILALEIINSANRNYAQMQNFDMSKFNQILGAGGFGIVIKQQGTNIVGKFLYTAGCTEAKTEHDKHVAVFNAFVKAQDKTNNYPYLCVSKPLGFNNKKTIILENDYSCYYLMEELYPLNENGLYHIINNEYSNFNTVVGKVYTEPVSKSNPSRGFFGTYNYIEEHVLQSENSTIPDIKTLLQYMGYAFGIILFIAKLFPRDVEYVLGRDKMGLICFTVLDFGLTEQFDFTNNTDILATQAKNIIDDLLIMEVYFPITQPLIDAFKVGFTDAFSISDQTPQKRLVYQRVIDEWDE